MTTARVPLLVALLLLVPLAPGATAIEREIGVTLHEYSGGFHIVPEQINAEVGDVLKLTIQNAGQSPHNFMVCGDGASPMETCDDVWGKTPMIAPNASAPLQVTVKKAGTFDYYCYVPGHKSGKMVGALVVGGADGGKKAPAAPIGAGLALMVLLALSRRRAP
ncbi:MAG TPA: cupredoxin domain-containing protein [Candidatus Thermoplasmatota archaeon]|nr:cupredoxin domain-containing protein [Candidatus Thermoplasmatota archaeon]